MDIPRPLTHRAGFTPRDRAARDMKRQAAEMTDTWRICRKPRQGAGQEKEPELEHTRISKETEYTHTGTLRRERHLRKMSGISRRGGACARLPDGIQTGDEDRACFRPG